MEDDIKPPSPTYDVLILGSGPAGLSAALALGRVRRTALVLSNNKWRNDGVAAMHNVMALDGEDPNIFRSLTRRQIEAKYTTISFTEACIVSGRPIEVTSSDNPSENDHQRAVFNGFELEDSTGRCYRSRKLIWAAGARDEMPDINGFTENWPQNIFQCLFCDGFERRTAKTKGVGVLAYPFKSLYAYLALQAMSFDPALVTIFTNGVHLSTDQRESLQIAEVAGAKVDTRRIVRLENTPAEEAAESAALRVVFDDQSSQTVGFLVNKPLTQPTSMTLANQLGIESKYIPNFGTVLVRQEPCGDTNVPGLYVCGDAGTQAKLVPVAMAHGVCAVDNVLGELILEEAKRAFQ